MNLKRANNVLLAALVGLAVANPVLADDSTTAPAQGDSLSQKRALEGHVQDEAVALEAGIKDLTKTLHHLKRSAWDIFVEVQRQNMVVVGEPDVIGPIIIPAIPSPTGMLPVGGFLPPRKKFLDYFMAQIDDLVKMTQTEVTAMVLPDDASDETKAQMKIINDTMATIPSDVSSLATATAGPNYNNMDIARAAQLLQDHVTQIEKASKKINSEMKKEVDKTKKDIRELDSQIKKEGASSK